MASADPDPEVLARATAAVGRSRTTEDGAREVLRAVLAATGARGGRLSLLDLATGSYVSSAAIGLGPSAGPPQPDGGATVPLMRGDSCIGLLELEEPATIEGIGPLANLAVQIYERRFLLRVLAESQQSIDFALHDDDFNEQIMALVALSSQMEYAVLHFQEDDGALDVRRALRIR